MSRKLQDKSAKILVIENSGAARQLVVEVIKAAGFEEVQGLSNLKDALNFFESDQADVVFSSVELEEEVDGLSFLKLCTESSHLAGVRFVLMCEDSETKLLPLAFQLGLLAWISKPFNKDSLTEAIEELISRIESHEGQESLVAAEYLRPILRDHELYKDWVGMEKKLLNLYPGKTKLLLNLAEPYYLLEQPNTVAAVLDQAKLLDNSLESEIDKLREEYAEGADSQEGEGLNLLGLNRVVVVDNDEAIQNSLKEVFNEQGVETIECFSDGEAAAEYIKEQPDPDLVVHEWRLPKLSGPLFVQRIIYEGAATTPVMLLSSLVQPKDMPLIKEMGIANIVSKPFDRNDFVNALVWTLQQDRLPTDYGTSEIKIRKLLRAKKTSDAEPLIAKFISEESIPKARRFGIEAEWAYHSKNYEQARDLGVKALKGAGDSINILNLLGKTFMQLRDFEAALKCLQKAQNLSPQNLERLCQIAETQTELGDTAAAEETLEEAKDLDPNAEQVAEAEVKNAMNTGDTKAAKKMMGKLEHVENIVAYMNNKAVALARCDEFDQSVEQYHKTLEALPANKHKLKSLVSYNLGLALARASDLEEAVKYLDLALKRPNPKIKPKAESLKNRLETAIKTGADFHLISAPDGKPPTTTNKAPGDSNPGSENEEGSADQESEESMHSKLVSSLMAEPGEFSCYLVFTPHEQMEGTDKIKALKFSPRASIEREETLKGEASLKSA